MRLMTLLLLLLPACGGDGPVAATPTACETYCGLAIARCRNGNLLYSSDAACSAACADFPDTGGRGDTTGDTLQCRLTWIIAADVEPLTFCRNASPGGGAECN